MQMTANGKSRLDALIASACGLSRAKAKKIVEGGLASVNGTIRTEADFRVVPGDLVEYALPEEHSAIAAEEADVTVLWNDEDIAVIDKPAGLTVHPCPSCPDGTLVNRLLARFPQIRDQDGPRPGIVHRIDKDTSGILIAALSERARLRLTEQFAERTVHKTYVAVAYGVLPLRGESRSPIGRHPTVKTKMAVVPEKKGGKNAHTEWLRLYADPEGLFSVAAVTIHTGRTHQIRVHMAETGHPLVGDPVYAPADVAAMAPRQMLHAYAIEFEHPVHSGQTMSFICPLPTDLEECIRKLSMKHARIVLTGCPGCGKSAALAMLGRMGFRTMSADQLVAEQYEPGADGWHLLRRHYGTRFTPDDSKPVDKKALAAAMADPVLRREINSLIHPLVFASVHDFFAQNEDSAAEVPLWFEAEKPLHAMRVSSAPALAAHGRHTEGEVPLPPYPPTVITMTCPEKTRHDRLRLRGWSDDTIALVDSWQLHESEKAARADHVVANNGSMEDLAARMAETVADIRKKMNERADSILKSIEGKCREYLDHEKC